MAASESITVHFLEQHQNLLYTSSQSSLFKPQASLLVHQSSNSFPLQPLESNFFSYKLAYYGTAIRLPLNKQLKGYERCYCVFTLMGLILFYFI